MIEFELADEHPLVDNLNRMLSWVRCSDIPNRVSGEPKCDISEENLRDRMAGKLPNRCLQARFGISDYDFNEVRQHSALVYEEKTGNTEYDFSAVSKTWYPAGGYVGWHLDQDGDRLYSAYAEGESFFRYRDPKIGEIITTWDTPRKWNFRIFTFDAQNPMWHCVHAKDIRVSVGYRFHLQ